MLRPEISTKNENIAAKCLNCYYKTYWLTYYFLEQMMEKKFGTFGWESDTEVCVCVWEGGVVNKFHTGAKRVTMMANTVQGSTGIILNPVVHTLVVK